jgi:CheY-like chemotaxis protein
MSHKLLLADDSITIQRVIELTFAEEDVQVLAVGDGKHAIDRIQSDQPDIVLADVGMPERDGYEVAAFVKGQPHLAHIPVLLLTGAFEPIDETRARTVGCDGVLVKPFEPQMVINRVKELLAGRKSGQTEPGAPQSEATSAADPFAAQAPNAKPGDSLEDYFDRLDAAFATLNSDAPASAAADRGTSYAAAPSPAVAAASSRPATVEDFASWDPDLAGDARSPAEHAVTPAASVQAAIPVSRAPEPPAAVPQAAVPVAVALAPAPDEIPPAQTAAVAPAPPPPTAAPMPAISLAEAFATLLAAEHGQAISPAWPSGSATPTPPSPEIVEDIVSQVLDRLQHADMRQTVIDVAERLVREEIDRIKRSNA